MVNLRSLFCTIPIGSLFKVKHCVEPNFGASEVVGTLHEANIDTVHLDLNAMLIKHRRDTNDVDQLTDTEKSILNNTDKLNEFLNDYTISPRLHEWATYLATNVQTYVTASGDSNIDFICYSLTHTQFRRYHFALAGFNFSIILRKYLDFIPYTVPLY